MTHNDPIIELAGICFNRLASESVEPWSSDDSPFLCNREKRSPGVTHFICQSQKMYKALHELLDVKSCVAIVKKCFDELDSGCTNCRDTFVLQTCHANIQTDNQVS
ncbi:unnamed product [Ostreococcus tauri]|uniref:Unnamed product n=1 Tax=Ostreococcus tauri TaxID=70448 RepID=A0A096PB42_OSTTA|nr:unnamed product [Ostreococcus tauri]CEG01895.1 unnamed product [Ostreococcus tauri]|eukprot:XP_022841234.1 unnamed product [Ostreococcus tauri]